MLQAGRVVSGKLNVEKIAVYSCHGRVQGCICPRVKARLTREIVTELESQRLLVEDKGGGLVPLRRPGTRATRAA